MKKFLKISILFLLLTGLVLASGCADKTENDAGAAETAGEEMPTYIVGTEAQFPPFEIVDDNGDVVGFDVDLFNAIAADQGFKVEYQDSDFAGLIPALETGNIDIIVSGLTITEEREARVDFSEPYINAGLAIAVLEGNDDIKTVDDLKGKTVVVQTGATGAVKAQELMDAGLIGAIKDYAHVNEAILEMKNGGAVAMINDLPVTQAFMAVQPGVIKIADDSLSSESYGFAVREGNEELLAKINTGLENVRADGTYDKLIANITQYAQA